MSAPPSSPTLEDHLKTHSPLHSALLLGPLPLIVPPNHPQTSHLTHTLSHLSTLLTTVSLLKNLPVLVQSKRQINIPHDISTKHNIVEEEVLRKGAEARGVKDGLYEIGTRGMDELITARRELKGKGGRVDPKIATPVFLAAVGFGLKDMVTANGVEKSRGEANGRSPRKRTCNAWKRSILTSSTPHYKCTTGSSRHGYGGARRRARYNPCMHICERSMVKNESEPTNICLEREKLQAGEGLFWLRSGQR